MIRDFGLWDQIRVDCGREWYLMLFMQEHLSHLRNDPSKPPHLRSSSKNVRFACVCLQVYNNSCIISAVPGNSQKTASMSSEPYCGTNVGRGKCTGELSNKRVTH